MTERETILVTAGAIALALLVMATLHERHYRSRRGPIDEARYAGLEGRLQTVENILREDRFS